MANNNPIKVDQPFSETEFVIPRIHSDSMIYLTIKVDLDDKDDEWMFASAHSIFLSGVNKYPKKTPEPVDLKLNYGNLLAGKRLAVTSHISRIHKESDEIGEIPIVKYTLLVEAGDILLDEFKAKSGKNNPTNFKSLLHFKIEK